MWAAITLDFLGMLTVKARLGLGIFSYDSIQINANTFLLVNEDESAAREVHVDVDGGL